MELITYTCLHELVFVVVTVGIKSWEIDHGKSTWVSSSPNLSSKTCNLLRVAPSSTMNQQWQGIAGPARLQMLNRPKLKSWQSTLGTPRPHDTPGHSDWVSIAPLPYEEGSKPIISIFWIILGKYTSIAIWISWDFENWKTSSIEIWNWKLQWRLKSKLRIQLPKWFQDSNRR